VVDNLLLVTTFPLYCIEPLVVFCGLDATTYYQYCDAFVIVFVTPLAFFAHSATVWSTTLIGVNRYIAVCHPYQVITIAAYHIIARLKVKQMIYIAVLCNPKITAEPHYNTPIVHWTLCRCQQYGAFSMKALTRYQII